MESSLGKKVTIASLVRFTLPTVLTMLFLSFYTIIDGIFISNYVGANALSATNIVFPIINFTLGISIMFATGGSAIVAKMMGEGKKEEANGTFTFLTIIILFLGFLVMILGIFWIEPLIYFLGATKELYALSYGYLRVILLFMPVSILKVFMDYFIVTAGKPHFGLMNGLVGGLSNIILDYIFLAKFHLGVEGAAFATSIGMLIPVLVSLLYFGSRKGLLYFSKPMFSYKKLMQTCVNGSSEMVTQLSTGITTYLFNITLLKYIGVDGVAAITIILYAHFLLTSVFLGFSSGIAPLISYNYGSENKENLNQLIRYGILFTIAFSCLVFVVSQWIAPIITALFTNPSSTLFDITMIGFRIFAIAFLFNGLNIFSSGMFTALSNGKISSIISCFRTLIFFLIGIFILPLLFGEIGIWLVVPLAEFLTISLCIYFLAKGCKRYGYSLIKNKGKRRFCE